VRERESNQKRKRECLKMRKKDKREKRGRMESVREGVSRKRKLECLKVRKKDKRER
jgi:hypothetical protein